MPPDSFEQPNPSTSELDGVLDGALDDPAVAVVVGTLRSMPLAHELHCPPAIRLIYRTQHQPATVGRRLQRLSRPLVLAALAALMVIAGTTAAATNGMLSNPTQEALIGALSKTPTVQLPGTAPGRVTASPLSWHDPALGGVEYLLVAGGGLRVVHAEGAGTWQAEIVDAQQVRFHSPGGSERWWSASTAPGGVTVAVSHGAPPAD